MQQKALCLAMMIGAIPCTTLAANAISTPLLENVIVTATKLPRQIADIAGTISVVSAKELEQQLASDIDDIVRYQPGISMDTAGRGGNQGFIIRGIGGNRVLTLIDGIRSNDIYSAGPASYGRDSFEVDDLKSVEIIRGPASVLYGADALGGAVILHTKQPKDYLDGKEGRYFALRSAGSSADSQAKVGFTAASQYDDWGFVAQYTRRDFKEKDIEGGAKLNPQDGTSDALLLKAIWTLSDAHQVSLTFDTLQDEVDYRLDSELSSSVLSSLGRDETERYRLSFNHHWQLGMAFADHVDNQFYWQKTDALQNTVQERTSYSFPNVYPYSQYGVPAIRDTDFEFNQQVKGFGSTLVKSFDIGAVQHAVVYGLNYEVTDTERPRNRCETYIGTGEQRCDIVVYPTAPAESFPNKTFPDTETTRSGIFWQDEMSLGDSGFTLIPGIRYDYYKMDASKSGLVDIPNFSVESVSESDVSVNLGLIYDVTDEVSLFAQYAEGFRPPNFDEANQSFVNLAYGYATVPNPNLKPETSQGIELGIKVSLANAYLSVAVFDNHYEDFINSHYIGDQGGVSLYQDSNIGEVQIYGAEFMGTWQLSDQWRLHSGVAYSHGDDEEANRPLDSVEPLTAVFGVAYSAKNNRWGIESTLTLAAEKDRVSDSSRVTSSGYGVVDMFGHYQATDKLNIRLGVYNLFNKQYARWANLEGLPATSNSVALSQESGTEFRAAVTLSF